jgi:hypothetical protein
MSPLELAAQFGFPALLVVILLKAQAARDKHREQTTAAKDQWYREQLAKLTAAQTKAIHRHAHALNNIVNATTANTAAIRRLTELQMCIATELAHSPCPLRHATAPFRATDDSETAESPEPH